MKNRLFIIGITSLITLVSCQKEESSDMIQTSAKKNTKATPNVTTATPIGWGVKRHYVGAPYYDCYPPATNCFDDVVIKSPKYADITACIAGGVTVVGSYFNGTSWHSIMPGLLDAANSDVLTDLQSGNYYFEEETNPTNGHKFVLVKDASITDEQDPKYVFEFVLEDDVVVVE